MTEDKMVRWHHQLNGHEFEQAPELVIDREAWHAGVCGKCIQEFLVLFLKHLCQI